jgi:hypothetical protein
MKICVYAFANTAYFFARLIEESRERGDAIEWSAVLPRWHHVERFSTLLSADKRVYLYEQFDSRYASIDATSTPFDLGSANDNELLCLLKDKAGYLALDGDEQVRRARTIVSIYRDFLVREKPDYLLFPDLEVVDGFLLLALCKRLGITPIYYVGMRTLGGGFFSSDCYESLPAYFGQATGEDLAAARGLLDSFLAGKSCIHDEPGAGSLPLIEPLPLWKRAGRAIRMARRYERHYAGEDDWVQRVKANLAPQLNAYRRWAFDRFQLGHFHLRSDTDLLPKKFVLYALQYTPESSINGLEPYYVDQLRAIDLLLAGMPSDHQLVVKEHPAMAGIRQPGFYRQLRRKPGVVLAAPGVSTRQLMQASVLVASVTGTIGLESYLLGIPCLLFGRNFFSHLCAVGDGPSTIRAQLTQSIEGAPVVPREERLLEVARLLNIRHPILLSDPIVTPDVLSRHNVRAYLAAVHEHIHRLGQTTTQMEK